MKTLDYNDIFTLYACWSSVKCEVAKEECAEESPKDTYVKNTLRLRGKNKDVNDMKNRF